MKKKCACELNDSTFAKKKNELREEIIENKNLFKILHAFGHYMQEENKKH